MKAEIFYYAPQPAVAEEIKAVLKEHVYARLEMTALPAQAVPFDSLAGIHYQSFHRYAKLLEASIPPSSGLGFGVTSMIGYGFYFYSYYASHSTFTGDACRALFPAVAIQDRMVMVPAGLATVLAGQPGSFLRAPEQGGAVETDFANAAALAESAQRVGAMLHKDVLEEFEAYMTYHRGEQASPSKVASDLGVDWEFVEECLRQKAEEASYYRALSCRLDRDAFPMSRWTRTALTIKNDSEVSLAGLAVRVSGPVRILPERLSVDLPAKSEQTVQFAVLPSEEGEFPLEFIFIRPEDEALRQWVPPHHIWVRAEAHAAEG